MARYDELLALIAEEENYQAELTSQMADEDILPFRHYSSSDRAANAAHLAKAEQQRIANLLTVADLDNIPPSVRRRARDAALEALGFDPADWKL